MTHFLLQSDHKGHIFIKRQLYHLPHYQPCRIRYLLVTMEISLGGGDGSADISCYVTETSCWHNWIVTYFVCHIKFKSDSFKINCILMTISCTPIVCMHPSCERQIVWWCLLILRKKKEKASKGSEFEFRL